MTGTEPGDIAAWAKEHLDVDLTPWQVEVADRLRRGETVVFGRQSGRRTVQRVLAAYQEAHA